MNRRTVIKGTGSAVLFPAIAGCFGDDDDESDAVPDLPMVENPPDAVYVPTHREAMRTLDPIEADEYMLAPMLSYPHPFWTVTGQETSLVEPEPGPGVHLMFTLWDPETDVVLPVDTGGNIRLERDGEQIGPTRTPWLMISQGMGFHFGDNVPLEDDGTYTVHVTIPPLDIEKTGELAGRFTESVTTSFTFEYDEDFRNSVIDGVEYFDEQYWGQPGAIEPMDHGSHGGEGTESDAHDHGEDNATDEHTQNGDDHDGHGQDDHTHVPYSMLPSPEDLPGTFLGEPISGDAVIATTLISPDSRLASESHSLFVSPRTPYNRVPLPEMSLHVTLERDGVSVLDTELEQTVDSQFGLHYHADFDDVRAGDDVTITVQGPPQVSRHQGYETAFLDMPSVELPVPEE